MSENKGISLTKGAKISLSKPGEPSPADIFIACGWDPAPGLRNVDLDLSAVLFDYEGNVVDTVWFRDLHNQSDPIYSGGDNLTGDGDGDDETIRVKLALIDQQVKSIIFVISSYKGHVFSDIRNAFARLVDVSKGIAEEKFRYDVSGMSRSTALVIVKLYRHNGEWKINAIGDTLPDLTTNCTVKNTIAGLANYL